MSYLLDSNIFIQAKNLHYGFDFCPAFWDWLVERNAADQVFSVEKVFDEIRAGKDDLAQWVEDRPDFFLNPDEKVVPSLQVASNWATGAGYDPAAVSTFLQVADYYLVSHAHAHGLTVVTHELPANSVMKIKIPNACIGLGVRCINPYEMLRVEQARFVLGQN
ncbi:MAG: hypothetical protein QOE56_1949 [Solirubrobacterales bacterium]|nr:hypothetical protein [Solirubrobacterales bacterium]